MTIKIQSVHFDADQKLLNFIEERVNKLSLFDDTILGAEVILRLDKNENTENKLSEIRLIISGYDLFAKRQCKSFEEAVDQDIEALKNQLSKQKGKKTIR